jgi:hypothetical protein
MSMSFVLILSCKMSQEKNLLGSALAFPDPYRGRMIINTLEMLVVY